MQSPLLVRPVTDAERQALEAGLRSSQAFTLRRAQIVLASARGEHVPAIARTLGCDEQTVRNAIRAFTDRGTAALTPGSSRPTPSTPPSTSPEQNGSSTSYTGAHATSATRPVSGRSIWRPRRPTTKG
jgi:hypothetical protein